MCFPKKGDTHSPYTSHCTDGRKRLLNARAFCPMERLKRETVGEVADRKKVNVKMGNILTFISLYLYYITYKLINTYKCHQFDLQTNLVVLQ